MSAATSELAVAATTRSQQKLMREFLDEYGCACVGTADGHACANGEKRANALTVGPLLGDGNAHRIRVSGRNQGCNTSMVLRDLRRRGWPKDEGIWPQCGTCQLLDRRAPAECLS